MANYASAYILATSVVIAIGGFAEFAEYSEMNKYVHTQRIGLSCSQSPWEITKPIRSLSKSTHGMSRAFHF